MKYSEERSFSRAAYYTKRLQDYVQKQVDASKTREERREAINAKMDVQSVMHILEDYFFLKNGCRNIPEWHSDSLNETESAKETRMSLEYAEGDGPKHSDICIVEKYASMLDENASVKDLLALMKGARQFRCPKCKGRGYVSKRYNAYPPGLPDSGWVDDWKKTDVECDLCNGHGWTEKEWKPKMVQDGWE